MASLITDQMGCPISFSSQIQAPPAGGMLQYFAGLAGRLPVGGASGRRSSAATCWFAGEPLGVVGVIAPWNVPQLVIMSRVSAHVDRRLHPRHQAGARDAAGWAPAGRDRSTRPACRRVSSTWCRPGGKWASDWCAGPGRRQDRLHRVTVAGRRVGSICGETLKRCTLELGGKSAAIILDDADLPAAIEGLRFSSFMINGQSCLAHSRILASRPAMTKWWTR